MNQTHQETSSSSFSTIPAYFRALTQTPKRLARRAISVSTPFEELSQFKSRSGPDMRRSLRWYDLVGLGIGGMVGAGVFVTAGKASHSYAGPAVVLSYAIAGFCALLSAFCYTEFAVDIPLAGGAFTYLRVTFGIYLISLSFPISLQSRGRIKFSRFIWHIKTGEFAAFLTGANLVLDYVLSNAAVARSFTAYLGTAIGVSTSKWRFTLSFLPKGFNEIDVIAVLVILIITLIICYRFSSIFPLIILLHFLL